MLTPTMAGTKVRNAVRALLQAYGTSSLKKHLWDSEFSNGRWDCLDDTPCDCVYPYVEKYVNRGSILDLGCGSGSTANELDARSYRHYTGVDISDVAIEKARRRTRENGRTTQNDFVQSDIFSYAPGRLFDVILFRDSIYYVPWGRIAGMLNRYAGHLEKTGVFIVRIASVNGKYRAIVDTIESHFDVVERYVSEQPQAIVLIFRPRPNQSCRML
jgi:2-polyprenyl-6-hydroxyphenyl methylase/3-demethylubiquinone-9 3-methyltransferase